MQRIPEPELMTDEGQAIAYANADFEEPHNHFIKLLKESIGNQLSESGTAMDLGCGAADISIRFAKTFPNYQIDALDGAEAATGCRTHGDGLRNARAQIAAGDC